MKTVQHRKSGTTKDCNMKKVQCEKSATGREYNTNNVQHNKVQDEESGE